LPAWLGIALDRPAEHDLPAFLARSALEFSAVVP
jgi:hypothetical protein